MKLYPIFLALIVSISAAHCQAQESPFSDTNAKEIAVGAAFLAGASYVGYQLFKFGYQIYQEFREDYILNATNAAHKNSAVHKKDDRIDTIVALIYTDLYPARLMNQLPTHEQKEVALAKSKLRARRTKMLHEIERRYFSSAKYNITFQTWLDGVKKSFAAIDALPKNAFEAPFDLDAHYRKKDTFLVEYATLEIPVFVFPLPIPVGDLEIRYPERATYTNSEHYDYCDRQLISYYVDKMVFSNKNGEISAEISQEEAPILEKLQMKDLDQASRDALPTIIFFYLSLLYGNNLPPLISELNIKL